MTKRRTSKASHRFESLPEFDKAMRHLITVPKEAVDKRMAKEQAKKNQKK